MGGPDKRKENEMEINGSAKGISRNGITVSVEDWGPWRKLPVLAVRIDGENATYKVASFNSKETAEWFCEIMVEMMSGLFKEDNNGKNLL